MRKKTKLMNFGDYGWPYWLEVEEHELRLLYKGAEELLEEHKPDVARIMVDQLITTLITDAIFADEVSPQWRSMAIMASAIQGILGDKIPDIKEIQD